jgi:hypothetical protein
MTRPLFLFVALAIALAASAEASERTEPVGVALGFVVESKNVCPRVLVRDRTSASGGGSLLMLFGSGSYERDQQWERLDCRFSPEALREAVVGSLATAGVTLLAGPTERTLLDSLGSTGRTASEQSRTWAARDAGADLLVTGRLSDLGEEILLGIQIVSTATGQVVTGPPVRFRRMEGLIEATRKATAQAVAETRESLPNLWTPGSSRMRDALSGLLTELDTLRHVPVPGRVVELTPDGADALVLAEQKGIQSGGSVFLRGTVVGAVRSVLGPEVVVRLNGSELAAGDTLDLPAEVTPLRLELAAGSPCGEDVQGRLSAVVNDLQPSGASTHTLRALVAVSGDCSALELTLPNVQTLTGAL